jgi:hypothetical protein
MTVPPASDVLTTTVGRKASARIARIHQLHRGQRMIISDHDALSSDEVVLERERAGGGA